MLCCGTIYAQNVERVDTAKVRIYFKQGYSIIDPGYNDNKGRLALFNEKLSDLERDSSFQIISVCVSGAASPEGNTVLNKELSRRRANNAVNYIPKLSSYPKQVTAKGVDWDELTRVVENTDGQYKDELLDVLKNVPEWVVRDGAIVDGRKRQLGMLRGGRVWRYLYDNYFSELRNATIYVIYKTAGISDLTVSSPLGSIAPKGLVQEDNASIIEKTISEPVPAVPQKRGINFAVKTNALYDLALVPNIGVEFFLNKGWSINAGWMYSWWKSDKIHYYWRTYGGELDVRKYLGNSSSDKPYKGHHLGIYAHMLTYDFETGHTGYLSKLSYGAGLEYGYSIPLARHLDLDFGIGLGYLGGEYKIYDPIDNHYVWRQTRQRNWFGPTKAEISLKWLIGQGNIDRHNK